MSKYSGLTHLALGGVPFCAFLILTCASGCAGDDPGQPIGEGTTAGSTGSGGKGLAGAPGTAGTMTGTAGTTTGTSGTTGSGGATSTAGTSAESGGAVGSSGASNGGAAGAMGGTPGGGSANGGGGGTGGTATSAGCSSAKICEDFEKDLDMSTWTLKMSGGFTAKIDTDQFHSGSHSLHVVAPNTTNNAWLTEKKTFPAADFWGRAWYRITGPKGGHQEYIIAPAGSNELRVFNRKTDSENMGVNTASPDKWYLTSTPVPQSTWFCYEFHVTETATTVYPNGKEATEVKPPGMKGITALSFGWQRWQTGSGPGEMWIDDIAVGDKQIGCE